MNFREESERWVVEEVSSQSTDYCPDISSWPAVAWAVAHMNQTSAVGTW
ncbi:hypothetical protein ACFWIA_14695 [Streptomyces sp. NPDC127068]